MAEETPMSPVNEAVPPKANPLAASASPRAGTLKLNPQTRAPGATGATQSGLKPGIKLPPRPGLATGIKLPPKPGATVPGLKPGVRLPTQSGLKPGLKLPTQPGIKPGVKLPTQTAVRPTIKAPARPVIRKPGETDPAVKAPLPIPPKPVTEAAQPVAEAPKPAEAPAAAPVVNLDVPKPEQPKPLETLKAVTQNLKSLTTPVPPQAILRKTGIIADAEMTDAQKQAAKSKTARIALSDAMGVAPVKNEALPMKTIRIKRPADIPGATNPSAPAPTAAAKPDAPAPVADKPVDTQAETKVAEAATAASFTQRKTLKISRPGGGAVRPTGKFGVKKPTVSTAAPQPAEGAASGVADIADIPDMTAVTAIPTPMPAGGDMVPDVPKGVASIGLVVQIAACLAIAFLGWLLYQNTQLPLYCGGCL